MGSKFQLRLGRGGERRGRSAVPLLMVATSALVGCQAASARGAALATTRRVAVMMPDEAAWRDRTRTDEVGRYVTETGAVDSVFCQAACSLAVGAGERVSECVHADVHGDLATHFGGEVRGTVVCVLE